MSCDTCVHESHMSALMRSCGKVSNMAQARLLLLRMQRRFSSLRFDTTCNFEKAGDFVESAGGILSPWRVSVGVVIKQLANLFDLSRDDVLETVEDMEAFARQCKSFYADICRSELNEDSRVLTAYATICERVAPAIPPCTGRVCPVCESLAALSPEAALATGPTALASLPAAVPTGLAPSVMGPKLASSSAAPATGLAAPPATAPQRYHRLERPSLQLLADP